MAGRYDRAAVARGAISRQRRQCRGVLAGVTAVESLVMALYDVEKNGMTTQPLIDGSPARATVFLDRDGVINIDCGYPHREDQLTLTPTAAEAIAMLNRVGCLVIVVTNQSGVARGLFNMDDVHRFHALLQARISLSEAHIDAFYISPYHRDGTVAPFNIDHDDRKPSPGMLMRAMREWPVDRERCVLIGDRRSDAEAAHRAHIPSIIVAPNVVDLAATVANWLDRLDLRLEMGRDWSV